MAKTPLSEPNPAAPVDLAEWEPPQVHVWVHPNETSFVEVPPAVLATLVAGMRVLREAVRDDVIECNNRECPLDTTCLKHRARAAAMANIIDTAGPGGSG